jgi:hypothetical protein
MIDQRASGPRQAASGGEDEMNHTAVTAPFAEHMDELALVERIPTEVIGQQRDTETGNRCVTHRAEVAASHARLVLENTRLSIVRLQMPFDQGVVV